MLRTKLTKHACLNIEPVLDLIVRLTREFNWIAAQAERVHAKASNAFETVELFSYETKEEVQDK